MSAFCSFPLVARVLARGTTKPCGHDDKGIQVDLRVVAPDEWARHSSTSQAPRRTTCGFAVWRSEAGLKLSEYGLFQVGRRPARRRDDRGGDLRATRYAWIPPTLREDHGEIEAARAGRLPSVDGAQGSPRRPAHAHEPHGRPASLTEMATAARGTRLRVLRDHRPRPAACHGAHDQGAGVAQRQPSSRWLESSARWPIVVARLRAEHPGGRLTRLGRRVPGATFDILIASVHSHFSMDARRGDTPSPPRHRASRRQRDRPPHRSPNRAKAAHRVRRRRGVRSGRAGRHGPRDQLVPRSTRPQRRAGQPRPRSRGRLRDRHRRACDRHLDNVRFGVATAQRGWISPERVINTWSLPRLQTFLSKGRRLRSHRRAAVKSGPREPG